MLFKNEEYHQTDNMLEGRELKNYVVLIWKFYNDLAKRHLYNYKSEMSVQLFEKGIFTVIWLLTEH